MLSTCPEPWLLSHYRDLHGLEVNFVLESSLRAVVGIEVKASDSMSARDFKGLRQLREHSGRAFISGIVLYNGEHALHFGDGLWAVPLSRFLCDKRSRLGKSMRQRLSAPIGKDYSGSPRTCHAGAALCTPGVQFSSRLLPLPRLGANNSLMWTIGTRVARSCCAVATPHMLHKLHCDTVHKQVNK